MKKNILLIMCDQLCADVLETYGGKIKTPNISRIAERGVTFSSCYCQTPVCTPSRGALITGLYPHQSGLVGNVMRLDYPTYGGPETEEGIKNSDWTTERVLHENGWNTVHVGKWHLSGEQLDCYPEMFREHQEYDKVMKHRFDKVGKTVPRDQYMDWYGWKLPVEIQPEFSDAVKQISTDNENDLEEFYTKIGKLKFHEEETYDWQVAQRCIENIEKADENTPFMITCSFNAPHDPNAVTSPYYEQADPQWLWDRVHWNCEERYQKELGGSVPRQLGEKFLREFLKVYAASVLFIDHQVGRVLDALEKSGRADDTIIVFTADHGDMAGAHGMFWKSTSAFYEQVARVPLIISAPEKDRKRVCDVPVELVDIPATLLDLCEMPMLPESSGVSLVPALKGELLSHAPVISERMVLKEDHKRYVRKHEDDASFMLRDGEWKYVLHVNGQQSETFVYNLKNDPSEENDLSKNREYANICSQLHSRLETRLKELDYCL